MRLVPTGLMVHRTVIALAWQCVDTTITVAVSFHGATCLQNMYGLLPYAEEPYRIVRM